MLIELVRSESLSALIAAHNYALSDKMARTLQLDKGALVESNPARKTVVSANFLLACGTSASSRVKLSTVNKNNNAGVRTRLDVPYGGGPQGNLCVDIYLPASAGMHPALLCLHGGAWLRGSRKLYGSWGHWLAERGYVVVAVDYRLSSQVSPAWPGVWDDVCRSLDWLIANASSLDIDPTRIATIGDSVGAHMGALLSLDKRTAQHIRAVVGVYGVFDLPDWWRVTQPPKRTDDPVGRLMGRSYPEAKEDYENFSPLHRLQRLARVPRAKYLIVYGDQDAVVNHDQSERFLAALRDKSAQVKAMLVPGAGHHWFTWAEGNPARRRVDEEPNATVAPALLGFLSENLEVTPRPTR